MVGPLSGGAALIRGTADGVATVFGLPLVGSLITGALRPSWPVGQYLPGRAGRALPAARAEPHIVAPWTGFAVFRRYTAMAPAGAATALTRRDT